MSEKIEIAVGATCTDPSCENFDKPAHPCEAEGHEHDATHTVTHDEVAVYYFCAEAVEEFVRGSLQPAEDDDTLGPCGCTDYHMADCPLRTGSSDYGDWDDHDPYYMD